jgi:type II secretory pathway component PulM
MKSWFSQLSQSERKLFLIGVVLVLMAMFWTLVFLPVSKKIDRQIQSKNLLTKQLAEMQGFNLNAVNSISKQLPLPANTTFSSWVDFQLSQIGLQELVNRTEPIDANTLTVWLSNAPFDQVIDWLQQINNAHAILVDQIDINVTDKSLGLTNIRMRLVKP